MAGLSPGSLRALADVVEHLRRLEGLPEAEEERWHPGRTGTGESSTTVPAATTTVSPMSPITPPAARGSGTDDAKEHDEEGNGQNREEELGRPSAHSRQAGTRTGRR
jgi:hypothetical protein